MILETKSRCHRFNKIRTDIFGLRPFAALPLADKLLRGGDPSVSHPIVSGRETNHQALHIIKMEMEEAVH